MDIDWGSNREQKQARQMSEWPATGVSQALATRGQSLAKFFLLHCPKYFLSPVPIAVLQEQMLVKHSSCESFKVDMFNLAPSTQSRTPVSRMCAHNESYGS